ncbi:4'-phosphopantetheinyl transferase superfamily protein [Streptomyces sp. BR123]|uniref:4'-phosphopantetheinyl transferase family protein n=1 Tax=Streptomyces sp. BR123 TaxID=2749828 RepID=UPI0015C4E461|nr:4'-phosphopantetheinyl transferase superfamily protein [Streptomyces sp. BR123]NXY94233.1 4'-phosphopantetheinyl transferase superfamily protein [Streptomyces sp. BR123]
MALAPTSQDTPLTLFTTAADRSTARQLPAQRRTDRLRARGLLRALLRDRFPAAACADIGYMPSGRPVLLGHPRLGISVSHVADACAVGVALDRAVGVDVQSPPQDVSDQLLRWSVPTRRNQLAALPPADRAREFTWMWTVKEACGKATGTGLAGPAFSLDVPPGGRAGSWGDYRWVSLRHQSPIPLTCAFSSTERGTPQ